MEAKQTGESLAALRKRLALETMNIAEEDSKTALSTLEGTFQVAFRTWRLWEVQESIFRKWERKELKSMKVAGKGKKKDDGEMRQTWWRPLQDVSDERKLSILLRVDAGELSLDKMVLECIQPRQRLKCILVPPHASHGVALSHISGSSKVDATTPCDTWDGRFSPLGASLSRCHPMRRMGYRSCSNSINKSLFGVEETEPEGGKRKRVSKAKSLVQVLPPEFLDHIDSARSYKEAKEAGREIPLPEQNYKHWVKEGSLQSVKWDVFHGDVRRMQSFVPREKYTLALAAVPYGFQLKDCSHDDSKPFSKSDVLDMLTQVGLVSSSIIAPACAYKIVLSDGKRANIYQKSQQVVNKLLGYFSRGDDRVPDLYAGSVILLEKDQVPGSAGTGGSEADDGGIGSIDGTEDPEGLDPEEEGAEAGEEDGAEDEQSLGEGVRVVPDSLLGE
ncbi:hypothetical protein R1sor_020440 [Riccia sorocarpa]|uniref:Uncharacterized protein n=1 Tax=Riccia sorocarpa TaxID=122646 RepID=A0ABD3IFB5_9MARC